MKENPRDVDNRPLISYPCRWSYRVIGNNQADLEKAISLAMGDVVYCLSSSRTSSRGKYFSVAVEVDVSCHVMRDRLYQSLAAHREIKMVL